LAASLSGAPNNNFVHREIRNKRENGKILKIRETIEKLHATTGRHERGGI
jgi:hypothetical protein